MPFRNSLKQIFRTPVRLALYFIVAVLAAATLCLSFNMVATAKANVSRAEASFTTIAVPQLWGNMNAAGSLLQSIDKADAASYLDGTKELPPQMRSRGYIPAAATIEEYDVTPILSAPGVESIDICGRFGARVNAADTLRISQSESSYGGAFSGDVIVFTVKEEHPVTLPSLAASQGSLDAVEVKIEVESSIRDTLNYKGTIKLYNFIDAVSASTWEGASSGTVLGNGDITLMPEERYIAILDNVFVSRSSDPQGNIISGYVSSAEIRRDLYYSPSFYEYQTDGLQRHSLQHINGQYPPIAQYNDSFLETQHGAYIKKIINAYLISVNSLTAIATNDAADLLPFHSGGVRICDGRLFSDEEYHSGAKVLVMSEYVAELNGWQLGDSISLSFYECDPKYYCDAPSPANEARQLSVFAYPTEAFFYEGDYKIIGLFAGNVENGIIAQYTKGKSLDAAHILLPKNSVKNAPIENITNYTTTIRIANDHAVDFMGEMMSLGLTDSRKDIMGSYELRLNIYDQGYSKATAGLSQLSRVSELTLLIVCIVATLSSGALSVAHILHIRKDVALLRSLGTGRAKISMMALSGIMLVFLSGAIVGAAIGQAASDKVTQLVINSGKEQAVNTLFTAMVAGTEAAEFEIILKSDPVVAILSMMFPVAVLAVTSLIMLRVEYKKPPMLLMGVRE